MLLSVRPLLRRQTRCAHFVPIRDNKSRRTFTTLPLTAPLQSYISTTHSPILNLSIEHHLLQSTPPESTVLFLYRNTPSIIIGRNQNPWLEVNLHALREGIPADHNLNSQQRNAGVQIRDRVELVRRRSGGGTVFHDLGNTNWTVISPPGSFTRDKSAEMVVRALRRLGIARARVNERHDIVLDTSTTVLGDVDADDTHRTPWTSDVRQDQQDAQGETVEPLSRKVSGSAYKLTRNRALHHGTALLSSPNLGQLSTLLRSPSKASINAKGVASVPSPVCNIGINHHDFCHVVQEEFQLLYGDADAISVGRELREVEAIRKGMDEMQGTDWLLGGTPGFEFRHEDMSLEVKHGKIVHFGGGLDGQDLTGRSLAEGWKWGDVLIDRSRQAEVLNNLLPTGGALGMA